MEEHLLINSYTYTIWCDFWNLKNEKIQFLRRHLLDVEYKLELDKYNNNSNYN